MRNTLQIVLCLIILTTQGLLAQEIPSGEIEDAQIIIEKDKPLTLPKASRMYQKTEVVPVYSDSVRLGYNLSQPAFEFTPYQFSLAPRVFLDESTTSTAANYVKAGFGNYLSPLVEGYYGKEIEDMSVGIWAHHESFGTGPVRKEESAYGHSEVLLRGLLKGNGFVIEPKIYFDREAFYYYGYDKEAAVITSATTPYTEDRIRGNHVSVSAALRSSGDTDISFFTVPEIAFTGMAVSGREAFNQESNFNLKGGADYQFSGSLSGTLMARFQSLTYKGPISQSRNVFTLAPSVKYKTDDLEVRGGVDLAVGSDSTQGDARAFIYPNIRGEYVLSSQFLVYADVTGGLSPLALYDARQINRYLDDSLLLLNQNERIAFKAGIQYEAMDNMVIEPYVKYSLTENKALIQPSVYDTSRFNILYDLGQFGQVDMGAVVTYLTNRTRVSAEMVFSGYQTDQVTEAWYLPTARLTLQASYLLGETIRLNGGLIILDGIKGMKPLTGEIHELPAIVDLSIGGSYSVNGQFSVFADATNLLGQQYERYYHYPVRGFSGKLGFIYRF